MNGATGSTEVTAISKLAQTHPNFEGLLLAMGFGFLLIMGLLCVMLLIKMWTNEINLSTILNEANGDASMSRFQLLIFTLVVAVGVFLHIIKVTELPEVPQSILTLLGISAGTY